MNGWEDMISLQCLAAKIKEVAKFVVMDQDLISWTNNVIMAGNLINTVNLDLK